MKIKRMNICPQQTFFAFNFHELPRPTKIFKHKNFTHKKLDMKNFQITVLLNWSLPILVLLKNPACKHSGTKG